MVSVDRRDLFASSARSLQSSDSHEQTDKYPLVVRLPCHKDHTFDMECIRPWLKLNPTCPLDRKVLLKTKEPPLPLKEDEEDGEWDDLYA